MELFTKNLFLCLAFALTNAFPQPNHNEAVEAGQALPNRCDGLEFDAITPDEKGNTFFFKGPYLWKGFIGQAQLSNETFKELDDLHHIGHVDAAFRMRYNNRPDVHNHIYFFVDDKVFSYYDHQLKEGYPKTIKEEFPGVPCHLDAAVECPEGDCITDSVLFFKGHGVYLFDLTTKTVKTKVWSHLPVCTSALRWIDNYYCFHGNNFTRFHQLTGEVNGTYPKDARNYFMSCPNFGHGHQHKVPKCSEVKIDAITADDAGITYVFEGLIYMRLNTHQEGLHHFPIGRTWPQVKNGVDAVFSYSDKIYMIKDDQVYIYKSVPRYTLVEGYPKNLKEELGIEGHVDAAFVCPNEHTVYIIKGQSLLGVDLTATPRAVTETLRMVLSNVDGAMCDANGIHLFVGSHYYDYLTIQILSFSKIAPSPLNITSAMMGCKDE